uniref:Uncharacterized protein n=1 Tax=Guillardia theta (strain CCMP2712) TaxID=905079 RepID=A0A0C3SZL6_GUITC
MRGGSEVIAEEERAIMESSSAARKRTLSLTPCLLSFLFTVSSHCHVRTSSDLAFTSPWLRTSPSSPAPFRASTCSSLRTERQIFRLQMSKKRGKKMQKVRIDDLLVERGLALHTKEAMALVLKKLVVVEEGKIPVDSVSTLIPSDANVRVKGRHVPVEERANMEQEAGFVLGEEMEGLVVAHHGSRVLVQVEEQSKELLTKLEEPAAHINTHDVRSLRYSCALNPSLKEIGVVTGDRVVFAPALGGDMTTSERSFARGVVSKRLERTTVLDRPSKSISELNVNDLQVLVPGYFLA